MPAHHHDPDQLNDRFAGPFGDRVRFAPGPHGLTRVEFNTALAHAEIYLHGGHITRFRPAGQHDVLYLSPESQFKPLQPIRGGVPICFPWFGPRTDDPASPMHGLARLLPWRVIDLQSQHDESVQLTLKLTDSGLPEATNNATNPPPGLGAPWPHPFELELAITIGRSLGMQLQITNPAQASLPCEAILHTYLAVSDVRRVQLQGLEAVTYLDKTAGFARKPQPDAPVTFTAETDRIYLDTTHTCRLVDVGLKRHVVIQKQGSHSTVVWNPWVDRARALPDLPDHDWPRMVCIESGNVHHNSLNIAPGSSHTISTRVSIEPLA